MIQYKSQVKEILDSSRDEITNEINQWLEYSSDSIDVLTDIIIDKILDKFETWGYR